MESLATKYRPKNFDDVVEQESVVRILQRQVETYSPSNAMLFAGKSGCVDKDTEFFNGKGWKKIADYSDGEPVLIFDGENRTARLETPLMYHKLPCDSFYVFNTKYGIDMWLSDEHTIVYENSVGNLNTEECKKVAHIQNKNTHGFAGKFLTTFTYNGKGIALSDDAIRLMCAVICDGSFRSQTNWCCINVKKQRKIDRLHILLASCQIPYKTGCVGGYTRFYFNAPRREKEFSDYWYNCNNEQLKVICDEILFWDGSISRGRKSFTQKSKISADFVQFAFTSCGYRCSIKEEKRRNRTKIIRGKEYHYPLSIYYRMNITSRKKVTLGKSYVATCRPLDGYKYCFTVSTHMWVMRRNGNIIITGNCGKTTLARILANKLNGGIGTPIEIDAASHGGVDDVRAIVAESKERAISGKYKVFIIDEAQSTSTAGWQAYLKAIEEPSPYTLFIFCTTDPQKLPPTILNRVMRFNLTSISTNGIKERLMYICKQEEFTNYVEACDYISKISNGGMRDAISTLEKAARYSTDLSINNVLEAIGDYSYSVFFKLVNALIDNDEKTIFEIIDSYYDNGNDLKVFVNQFFNFCVDVAKYVIFRSCDVLCIPNTMEKDLQYVANFENADKYYSYVLDRLLELKNMLKDEVDIRSVTEVMLLRIARGK